MSFGLSFGDLVLVLTLANKLRRDFVGAPSQFNSISREVRGLAIILQDVDVQLPSLDIDDRQLKQLGEISHSCGTLLRELQDAIGKYKVVEYCGTSIHKKARSIWKRISWEPKDIGELRDRLLSNVTLLQSFLNAISSQTMAAAKQTLEQLNQRQESQEETYILDWLTTVDYTTQQSDFLSRRQAQTGEWLLASEQYKSWLQTRRATLFCPGMPGAGKTICSAIVVDDLTTRFEDNPDVGIAYIYCNFNRNEEQQAPDLLLSLLKQLSRKKTPIPDPVRDLYKRYKTTSMRPQFEEISRALCSIIATYSGVFIVIDALDECQSISRMRLLAEITKFRAEAEVNVFATSRPMEINDLFKAGALLEICAHEIDVRRYLDGNMFRLPGFVGRNIALQEEIMTAITRNTQGMFLLAQLHFESLIGRRSAKSTRTALKEFSEGFNDCAYDNAYKSAMSRIQGQQREQIELAMQTLSWLICARRPLTPLELQHALAIEEGESSFDEENVPQIEDILNVCAGLVTVENESNIIRLVHYTTREYLERKREYYFPNAETEISTRCVTYISFNAFGSGICNSDEAFEERLLSFPFYFYAVRHWCDHVRMSQDLHPDVINFLEDQPKVEALEQALNVERHSFGKDWSQKFSISMTGLHLAAYLGIKEAVYYFLQNQHPVDSIYHNGWTALQLAISRDHLDVIQLLLSHGANPNGIGVGPIPLSLAAIRGQEAIVWLLVGRGAQVDAVCGLGESALITACDKGQLKIVEILLQNNADVNVESEEYASPLETAALAGHWTVVHCLLDKGANPNSQGNEIFSALHEAAYQGREDMVQTLLNCGADVNKHGGSSGSALIAASIHGGQRIAQMLLDSGANVNAEHEPYGTALVAAAWKGNADIVKMLLDSGANVNGCGRLHGTALHAAASIGSAQVVQMLLDRGANTSTRAGIFKTAFRAAMMRGHPEVASLLRSQGHQIRV